MYELVVEETIFAAHQLDIGDRSRSVWGDGEPSAPERLHGHNWRVILCVGAQDLDAYEMVADFEWIQNVLNEVLAPFAHRTLNDCPPFDKVNPTAESLAKTVFSHVETRLDAEEPARVRPLWVEVWETPTCRVRYRPQTD